MMNVLLGRWKMICQPAQDIALGSECPESGSLSSGKRLIAPV